MSERIFRHHPRSKLARTLPGQICPATIRVGSGATPPVRRRRPFLTGCAESCLRVMACVPSDGRDPESGVGKRLCGELSAPVCEILHRRQRGLDPKARAFYLCFRPGL